MKYIKKLLFVFAALIFASCSNGFNDSSESEKYGSLTIVDSEVSPADTRALDVSTLTTATVTVSGSGMDDIIKENVTVSDGKGSFTIDGIKIGKNRIVTVKSNVDGAVIRAVCDIHEGENTPVSVTWKSTVVANVYYELLQLGLNISEIDKSSIESKIPQDVHASLVDAKKIAEDIKNGTSTGSYLLNYGNVEITANNVSGYKIQVTDIASEIVTVSSANETKSLKAYPGTWKVKIFDASNTLVETKDVIVASGKDTLVDVSMTSGTPYDFTEKTIIFVKGSNTIWAWEVDGVALSDAAGGKWDETSSATQLVDVPAGYMEDSTGWKMIDYSSYATGKVIKFKLNFSGSEITGKAGTFWYDGSSSTSDNPSPVSSGESKLSVKVTNPSVPVDGVKVYVSADSAPTIWIYADGQKTAIKGEVWPGPTMKAATGLNNNEGWYFVELDDILPGKTFKFHLNKGDAIDSGKSGSFWYDANGVCGAKNVFYDADPTVKPDPVAPTVTLSPNDGSTVRTTGSISVEFTNGYDTISSAKITINGKEYDMGTSGSYSISLEKLGITTDRVAISVSASVTNSIGTTTKTANYTSRYVDPSKEDSFTWDNVNAYFVLTDRFYNGDTKNDHSYFRKNGLSGDENVATFHGGDIAGLTQKLDYFDKLGVNAIWITAPYEQAHGWVGGKNNAFPHYAFHGYYTLDWTSMDQNMGTVEELRTFVNACHSKGIRVIMDVVMNHVGYNNTQDMVTYKYGYTEHTDGWLDKTDGKWDANNTVKWDNSYWDNSWFGPWIRSFGYDSGSEYGGTCGGLPDVKTELTSSVGLPPVLINKWKKEKDSDACTVAGTGNTTGNKIEDYKNPSVSNVDWLSITGDYRTDRNIAPADYQVAWLSAWVREVGIDGFRCDTAKHVEPFRWGQLKKACTAALEAWRNDSTKSKVYNGIDTGAADWDEAFWMTGEHFGWKSTAGQGDYYTTGGFDSMINFQFNESAGAGTSSSYPKSDSWNSYISINQNSDSDNNGNRNNVLTYISSHDTRLCRASNQIEVGTMLTLLPGGIQIFYGDETSRPLAYTGCGDTDMATRGDFNWNEANGAIATHWGKVGNFRKYNPAVGAGSGSGTKRTYSGPAGENKVAIGINGASVDVSGLFNDGTTVYNWYDGKSATVSGGKVTFAGGTTTQPILVSEKDPTAYGLTF